MPDTAPPLTADQLARHLRRADSVARRAMAMGRHPFGALLLAPDGETVLAEQGNIDTVNHAESTLARQAAANYPGAYLAQCTLVTTFEPCAMCAGTVYWAGIGRVVYGAEETALLALTGAHPENPTLSLPCREVFARGQRPVAVVGPVPEVQAEMLATHRGFWLSR
ncbi:nucleoside deaminase [Pseudorhodoferax sp. Leaf267]|uniref:nucleoside deaminase n=1 Tax=Pseudorhodoferax sp. Leaf267 TaxID=1736316 RepID=UPI0006F2897F|nr:nucleoside deaminase [Pseudorhodoferax sp. Leaf267]KQP22003.1 cytidine deaminase [Pseudorhodoferax sp. Leaf267]